MDLRELASQLGLSMTTVSRALNGYPEVSAKTRDRVLAAAEAVGYRANPVARRLATGRSDAVALVLVMPPERLLPVAALMLMPLVGEALRSVGMDLLVVPTVLAEAEQAGGRLIQGGRADVLVSMTVDSAEGPVRIIVEEGSARLMDLTDPPSLAPVAPRLVSAIQEQVRRDHEQRTGLRISVSGGPCLKAERVPSDPIPEASSGRNDRRAGQDRRIISS